MFLSLLSLLAVITSAMGMDSNFALVRELLFPIAVFVFAMTFFMRDDQNFYALLLILTLDVLAALALISLNFPGLSLLQDSLGTKSP